MKYIKVIYDCNLIGVREEDYFIVPDNYCDRDIENYLYDKLDDYYFDVEGHINEEDYDDPEEYEAELEYLVSSLYFEWFEVNPLSEEYKDEVFSEM